MTITIYDMDIVPHFQRLYLCHVEIRRLLLIIGMVVAVIVVVQCHRTSLFLSPAYKGSMVMMVSNASLVNNSASNKISMVMDNDEETDETDMDYDLALGDEYHHDDSFHKYKVRHLHKEYAFKERVSYGKSLIMGYVTKAKAMEIEHGQPDKVVKVENSYEIDDNQKVTTDLILEGVRNTPSPGNFSFRVEKLDASARTSESVIIANLSSIDNVKQTVETKFKNPELSQAVSSIPNNNFTAGSVSTLKRQKKRPTSIFQMNLLLLQNHISPCSVRPRWSFVRDRELLSAKVEIENAPVLRDTPRLYASVFRNVSKFQRSYELMEHVLKVYFYKEGEKPIFHQPHMKGIYASEGWFMKLMEGNKKFAVRDPRKAHLFYLPFSVLMLRRALFGKKFRSHQDLQIHLKNYVELIARKYRYWNRTGGADHFVVACHDWAPGLTSTYMGNCIRALCNANVAKGFDIGMDTTLPVTNIHSAGAPLEELGGKPPLERSTLAFFAGSMHGYLRPKLLKLWENKEADMKIFGPMPRDNKGKRMYREYMKSSKYCICARGYEVHTPRVVEAIFYECVPVIISDNYVPPLFEVLNWEAFSVFVMEKDIPNLRNILLSIPEEGYLAMQSRVKMVQKHFLWHKKPEKYDLFHMILHSVWYNRVFNTKTK